MRNQRPNRQCTAPLLTAFFLTLTLSGAPLHAATIAITNATIYTADQAGVISSGTLVMRDGKIIALGQHVTVPADATLIDGTGQTLTPGFFAPMSTLGVVEVEGVDESDDHSNGNKRYSAALDMIDAFNPNSTRIPIARVDGVTRAMVAPESKKGGSAISGQGMVISLGTSPNWLVKPQAAMFAQFGEQGAGLNGNRASAVLALREAFEEARDAGKKKDGSHPDPLLTSLDIAALRPVLAGKTPLVMSANRASDITAAMALANKYKFKLIIEGGAEAWVVATQLAKQKVTVILDPESFLPSHFESLGSRADNARLLQQAGVSIAFSSGGTASQNTRNLRQLAGNAINAGVEPQIALAAITLNPAKMLGLEKQLGSLVVGKTADVVVWNGDPFELASYPNAVFIDGERMPSNTRQTALRDRYMKVLQLK